MVAPRSERRAPMTKRFWRVVETMLPPLCAKADAFCHEVQEDETGWDYMIEFPLKPYAGPADMRPPPSCAYVQVKSTTQEDNMVCSVKLSNALRAAESPYPWFI